MDPKLYSVNGVSFTYDTVEGLLHDMTNVHLPESSLSLLTLWKSKLAMSEDMALSDPDAKAKLKLGLFSYPVLQAADILLYRYPFFCSCVMLVSDIA